MSHYHDYVNECGDPSDAEVTCPECGGKDFRTEEYETSHGVEDEYVDLTVDAYCKVCGVLVGSETF